MLKYKIQPWKHQLEAIHRAQKQAYFGLFFDMGTGKTCTSINILRAKCQGRDIFRTLIFCPPVVIENWKREFLLHSDIPEKLIIPLVGSGSRRLHTFNRARQEGALIFITNYESLQMESLREAFAHWKAEMVICDESHKLKDPSTKRSKHMQWLVDGDPKKRDSYKIPHRLLLTGTPVLNSPMDLFGQFLILDGGDTFGKNQFVFKLKYFFDANAAWKSSGHYFPAWKPKPESFEQIQALVAKNTLSIKKSECLDLPPLVRQSISVEMLPEQARLYQEMKQDLVTYLGDQACVAQMALTKALRLLQIASGFVKFSDGSQKSLGYTPKMEALKELLEEITPHHKVLIWAVFRENYAQIRAVCESLKLNYVEVHGDISPLQKQKNVDEFNHNPGVHVFIGHPGSGGIGINLVQASYSIFFSRSFSLADDLQAEARNYRGGSEIHSKITRLDLITKDTIEQLVCDSLANKQAIGEALIQSWKTQI